MVTQRRFSNRSGKFVIALLLISLVLIASAPRDENSAGAAPVQRRRATFVFAIAGEPDEYHMDAIVQLIGKQLTSPFTDEEKVKQKIFGDSYFATGKQYRLIFGGGEAGTVTVKKWSEGCNSIHSEVAVSSSARLGGKVRALATNSTTLGKRGASRRPPTDAERAAVMTLMKSIYSQRQTPASLIGSIKVTNLTATDIDNDGKHELVGSFTLASKNKFERDLFLIAKAQGTAMRADFVKFQAYQPPPEEFLHSIDFIDQLDLDGDGTGEVFAVQGGFDGYGYLIYKKVAGRWREVYAGLGDAC